MTCAGEYDYDEGDGLPQGCEYADQQVAASTGALSLTDQSSAAAPAEAPLPGPAPCPGCRPQGFAAGGGCAASPFGCGASPCGCWASPCGCWASPFGSRAHCRSARPCKGFRGRCGGSSRERCCATRQRRAGANAVQTCPCSAKRSGVWLARDWPLKSASKGYCHHGGSGIPDIVLLPGRLTAVRLVYWKAGHGFGKVPAAGQWAGPAAGRPVSRCYSTTQSSGI